MPLLFLDLMLLFLQLSTNMKCAMNLVYHFMSSYFWSYTRLKEKTNGMSRVREILLDYVGVDSLFLGPAVPEIFYFKHDVGASPIIIFSATLTLITLATPFQFYPKTTPQISNCIELFCPHK